MKKRTDHRRQSELIRYFSAERRNQPTNSRRRRANRWIRARLVLQKKVDFLSDPDSMLTEFSRLPRKQPRGNLTVVIDCSIVESIEATALAFIYAQVTRINFMSRTRIRIKPPRNAIALKCLVQSGIFEYIEKKPRSLHYQSTDVFTISAAPTSDRINPLKWRDFIDFLLRDGFMAREVAAVVGNVLNELTENAKHHAYCDQGGAQSQNGWWIVLALRPSPQRPARAVVVDFGAGIPASIRGEVDALHRKGGEKSVLQFIRDAGVAVSNMGELRDDARCIELAASGAKRSRSDAAARTRGTGLRKIVTKVVERHGGSFYIVSGRAAMNWAGPKTMLQSTQLSADIGGTLLCIQFEPVGGRQK